MVMPAVGIELCVNRVTLVCDFGHITHAVEIEAVLDSHIEAGLRKNALFATWLKPYPTAEDRKLLMLPSCDSELLEGLLMGLFAYSFSYRRLLDW